MLEPFVFNHIYDIPFASQAAQGRATPLTNLIDDEVADFLHEDGGRGQGGGVDSPQSVKREN